MNQKQERKTQGTKINIALNPNSGDEDFIAAFKKVEDFVENVAKPELIILQCGADGIGGDPFSSFTIYLKNS